MDHGRASNRSRWAYKDDVFLHAYFDAVGDAVGTHDLGRAPGAATRRVAYLKRCGAWACLTDRREAEKDYFRAIGSQPLGDD